MIPTYIINLERNSDRKNRLLTQIQTRQLDKILDIHWFNAIDGNKLSETDIKFQVDTTWFEPTHKKPITRGEIGCALSHYSVWEIISKNNHQYALIFEDDIIFTDHFVPKINFYIDNMPIDTDFLYIYRKPSF